MRVTYCFNVIETDIEMKRYDRNLNQNFAISLKPKNSLFCENTSWNEALLEY